MYFRINDETKKKVKVIGFDFFLRVRKITQFDVKVSIETLDQEVIDEIEISDEAVGVRTAQDILGQSVINWIEENTDEADRVMNSILNW